MASLDEESTANWLRTALNGDQAAYRRFLLDITPVVRGIVRARLVTQDRQIVEDVLQEVLLAIHAKRHTWEQDQPVLPWVYAIARYKAIDALRRTRVEMRYSSIEDVQEDLLATDTELGYNLDVDLAVAQLKGRVQQVVRAMGIEGASVAEIGNRLNISENAVRVAFHRGLAQLVKLRPKLMGESEQSPSKPD